MSKNLPLAGLVLLMTWACSKSEDLRVDPKPSGTGGGSARILASSLGAALNSDLMNGGGSDDTAALQGALDQAKGGRGVHLIIDGPALVRGLEVHSNTTVECTAGGGLYLKDGSHRAILRNAHRSKGEVIDRFISVRNCFLNGNSDGQPTVGPIDSFFRPAQEPDGTFISGLQFFGVHHLAIENVTLWNIRSFGAWVANSKYIKLRDITVDVGVEPFPEGQGLEAAQKWTQKYYHNQDGVHLCGPIQYLTVDGLLLRTLDDGLSLTADDAADAKEDAMGPYVGGGPITDVTVNNVVFMGVSHAIRLLSATSRVDRIVITNLSGTVRQRMAVISPFLLRGGGNFGSVIFSNVAVDLVHSYPHFELHALLWKDIPPETRAGMERWNWSSSTDLAEETDHPLFSLNGKIENLHLRHVVTKGIADRPLIRVGKYADIGSMTVDLSVHDPELKAIPMALLGKVDRLQFLLDWQGKNPIRNQGGSITRLRRLEVPEETIGKASE